MARISPPTAANFVPFRNSNKGRGLEEIKSSDAFLLAFRQRLAQKVEAEICKDLSNLTEKEKYNIEKLVHQFNVLLSTVIDPGLKGTFLVFKP